MNSLAQFPLGHIQSLLVMEVLVEQVAIAGATDRTLHSMALQELVVVAVVDGPLMVLLEDVVVAVAVIQELVVLEVRVSQGVLVPPTAVL